MIKQQFLVLLIVWWVSRNCKEVEFSAEWKINLVSAIVALVCGIAAVLVSTTLTIVSLKQTTLSVGLLLTGGSLGAMPSIYTIYKLERILDQLGKQGDNEHR